MWNSRTGIKELTREYLMTMYYENWIISLALWS
jgi:hypothetical protein